MHSGAAGRVSGAGRPGGGRRPEGVPGLGAPKLYKGGFKSRRKGIIKQILTLAFVHPVSYLMNDCSSEYLHN